MASGGKKKTTMAKLMRERKVLERRLDKQAKKNARKLAAAQGLTEPEEVLTEDGEPVDQPDDGAVEREDVVAEREPVAHTLDA